MYLKNAPTSSMDLSFGLQMVAAIIVAVTILWWGVELLLKTLLWIFGMIVVVPTMIIGAVVTAFVKVMIGNRIS